MWQPRVQRGHLFGEKTQYELFRFSKLHLGALALAVAGAGADLARAAAVYRKILKLGSRQSDCSSSCATWWSGQNKISCGWKIGNIFGAWKMDADNCRQEERR